jgi:putative ABC transport system permease protein
MYRATADPSTAKDARATGIDHDFTQLYGIELVAGEPFREGMPTEDFPILVNETMVRNLGFASNAEAVDQRIVAGGGPGFLIKGVLKDFNWSSAHQATEAVALFYEPAGRNISLKLDTRDLPATLASLRRTYETQFPGNPFEYFFADASFDEQYRADERFAALFGAFAGIAIGIACLGLFGLAAFTAGQRTREIGVRKVLGASVGSIVALLSKDFLKLVAVAFVVAVPVAYYFMDRWLDAFAYRIEMGPGVFLLAGALSLLIALLTVSYQSVRAAVADPVDSLRYE